MGALVVAGDAFQDAGSSCQRIVGAIGSTLRLFDRSARQWSLHWLTSLMGRIMALQRTLPAAGAALIAAQAAGGGRYPLPNGRVHYE